MSKYLDAAKQTANYIDHYQVKTDHGIYWDISNSFNGNWHYYDEISLYAGSAGIIKFLLALYQETQDDHYLNTAKAAGDYLIYRWQNERPMKKAFSPYAFTTGYSGVGFILDELYQVSNVPNYRNTVTEIAAEIIKDSDDKGYWSGQAGIVADSGTVLFLISLVDRYEITGLLETITSYGDYLISQKQHSDEYGDYYVGLDLKYVGGPIGKFNTGFPLGPAGVAFTLLKIYELTGEKRFLDAISGIKDFYENESLDERAILLPHYLPDDNQMCYAGYCGGPVGVSRYFYEYYRQLNDPSYLESFKQSLKGLEVLGIPKKRSAGYWKTDNYCCGTAGVLQLYVGAYLAFGDQHYFNLAEKIADDLLERATTDQNGLKWIQAFERKEPQNLTAALGYYDGAAGIATSLLQFHQLLTDHFAYHRVIDDPYPAVKQIEV
ncbi:lanthionine synthetase LanC family protein [Loigolactobacillus binensis]|uniref:Lanthionine synthetase LanC family protein n=1 Tax=Loigolactobacillus binensis TaxID=2559922 RepID=A0ABW3E9T9_9LACO|nr:lanthionine synthetase LanC family protein [Loigolactobacillus binensis]